jgi:hypothetical protein
MTTDLLFLDFAGVRPILTQNGGELVTILLTLDGK